MRTCEKSLRIQSCPMPDGKLFHNLEGRKFQRLKVVSFFGKKKYACGYCFYWKCICDCGSEVIINGPSLRTGNTQSCGCLFSERKSAERTRSNTTHGQSRTPEYAVWNGMLGRCRCIGASGFENYGGRGIKVCARWSAFEYFLADMGKRPTPSHTIERKDTNGDYEPLNCVWVTRKSQNRNKRTNRIISIDGEAMCASEWEEKLGLPDSTISNRLRAGWSERKAVTQRLRRCKKRK